MSHSSSQPRRALPWSAKTVGAAAAITALSLTSQARADEQRKVTEPSVLQEPAEITQVVDAFDEDDPFDLNISLGFQRTWNHANIRREGALSAPAPTNGQQTGLVTGTQGDYVADTMNVAQYAQTTSRLNTRIDVGIYHDLALILRAPIILADDRELTGLDGSDGANAQAIELAGAPGEQLFRLPFKSPTRSGIEYLSAGIDLGIMNQYRDPTKPTWVIGFEGRFNVSEPMHACNSSLTPVNLVSGAPSQQRCAYPSDINRNGISGEKQYNNSDVGGNLEGNFSGDRKPGVSRGVTGLEVHTYLSKRVKYVEPYGGFNALFEFQNDSSDYGAVDLKGSLVNHPPLRGSMVVGMAVIPWEVREQYQRVTFDFRLTGTYVSEGRDYSELFDALGSSDAPSIRQPQFAEYQHNSLFDRTDPNSSRSVINPQSQKVYFTGLTDVQQHAGISLSTQFTWQAGQYIKFNVGGALGIQQAHLVTFDQACNPDFSNDIDKAGPCHSAAGNSVTPTGIPNPNFRRIINDPGRRFIVDSSRTYDAWINAVVMF